MEEHGVPAGAGDVGVDVGEQVVVAQQVGHQLTHGGIEGDLDEAVPLVQEGPHPLVGSVLVDVVGAVGDLGRPELGEAAPEDGHPIGREKPLEQAVSVLGEVRLRPAQVPGQSGGHGQEHTLGGIRSDHSRRLPYAPSEVGWHESPRPAILGTCVR